MALKNFHEQTIKSKIRELRGTLVSNTSGVRDLCFLTSDGVFYNILKDNKFHQLHSLAGESLKVSGFVHDLNLPIHTLVVDSFDIDFSGGPLADDEKIDDVVFRVPIDPFIDYESFNS